MSGPQRPNEQDYYAAPLREDGDTQVLGGGVEPSTSGPPSFPPPGGGSRNNTATAPNASSTAYPYYPQQYPPQYSQQHQQQQYSQQYPYQYQQSQQQFQQQGQQQYQQQSHQQNQTTGRAYRQNPSVRSQHNQAALSGSNAVSQGQHPVAYGTRPAREQFWHAQYQRHYYGTRGPNGEPVFESWE